MRIFTKELPPIGTNAVLFIDEALGQSIVFDAPQGAYAWASALADKAGCKITGLILTHGHWDHIIDAHRFADAGIPTYAHREDALLFQSPDCMTEYAIPGLELMPVSIRHWLEAGSTVEWLGRKMEVRHIPGHCPGNILIYSEDLSAAVVGDAIFAGSVGRYDLPGGDGLLLMESIRKQIYTLPEATTLYPGHGPTTTVGREKHTNPFVRDQ